VRNTQAIATSASGAMVYRVGDVSRDGGFDVFRSSDYGITWENVTNEYIGSNGSQIAVSDDGSTIVITQYQGYIWISRDFGNSWVKKEDVISRDMPNFYSPGAGNWWAVAVSATGQRMIIHELKNIYISNDFGETFSSGREVSGAGLADCDMSDDGRIILIGTMSTGVFISKDYGANFSRVTSLPSGSISPVAVSGDGNHLLAAAQTGGVWISNNSALSWSEGTLPQTLQQYDKFWVGVTISEFGSRIVITRSGKPPLTSDDSGATFKERNTYSEASAISQGITSSADSSRIYAFGVIGFYTSYFGLPNSGTVSFYLPDCGADTSADTSIAAASVALVVDTMTAATQSDGATYIYFTETDTALWGATYNYGQERDTICQYSDLSGSVIITRARFISSVPAFSETTTNTVDFIQFVGGYHIGGRYSGSPCGNLGVRHAASVTQSCSPGILADYRQLSQFGMVDWRDQGLTSGIRGQQSGSAYVAVKIKRSAIRGAPTGSTWSATETFTLTSV